MNNELIKNMCLSCNHSKQTQNNYNLSLRKYCEYFDMSLEELLMEAEEDEKNNVRWKNCRLRAKLIEFRHHLLQNYAASTVKKDIWSIKFFYKFYDIEIQSLPRVTQQSLRKPQPIYYKDLPDKEVIREAFKISSPLMKAIILFSCSSGCARAEALSLTIQDYIDAVSEYIPRRRMDIFEVIDFLNEKDDVVPTFNLRRKKTNKYYITYCSPEAVNAINAYILTRTDSVKNDSPLFDVSPTHLGRSFQKINDTLNLGNVGKYARFRSHMLRKFHASALYNDGMSIDKVNDLQGKAKNVTDSVYFMTNPEELKYEYIRHLPAVTINMDVEKLSIKSPEFMQLENDKKKLETELEVLKREVADIRSMKKDFELLKAQIGK
ncbi:site-specific integrase [uncultured Methanobrevibacter sp.]|uniref:tyrosine-type recombinase/integrase n=1 Tax=uncultured Methanobrevibacter sp. TaxID=253161 RepID=UPI0025CF5E3D|nr:site-specific integrase [uncultured Methanobrevibacter sp.]